MKVNKNIGNKLYNNVQVAINQYKTNRSPETFQNLLKTASTYIKFTKKNGQENKVPYLVKSVETYEKNKNTQKTQNNPTEREQNEERRLLIGMPNKVKVNALLQEAYNTIRSLFEIEEDGASEMEQEEENKIKKVKKDKNGKTVELVSVEDELFPYEGTKKQQYNQKIIAKINDMIEGKGTLEDLIRFIKSGKKAAVVHENLEVSAEIVKMLISEIK